MIRTGLEEEFKEMLKPVYGIKTVKSASNTPKGYEIVKVMNWFMTNCTEPHLEPISKNISETFDMEDTVVDISWIWWSILLLPLWCKKAPGELDTLCPVTKLYSVTHNYLPKDLQNLISHRCNSSLRFDDFSDELKEKVREFNQWLYDMRDKLEVYMLRVYWLNGSKKIEYLMNKLYREHFYDGLSQFTRNEDKTLSAAQEVRIELIEEESSHEFDKYKQVTN